MEGDMEKDMGRPKMAKGGWEGRGCRKCVGTTYEARPAAWAKLHWAFNNLIHI